MVGSKRGAIAVVGALLLILAAGLLLVGADTSLTTTENRRLFGLWRLRHVAAFLVLFSAGTVLILHSLSRTAFLYATICLATLGSLLVVLEGVGRAGLVDWSAITAPAARQFDFQSLRAPNMEVSGETYQDTAFIWGLASDPVPFEFRTDRHGFRNTPDRAAADIILLGDSTLVGALVPAADTVSARLDAMLSQDVMQVAVIGTSPQHQHDLLRASKIDLRGKTVVQVIFEGNDLLDSRQYRISGTDAAAEQGSSLVNQLWLRATRATTPVSAGTLDTCTIGEQVYTFLWTDRAFLGHEDEMAVIASALGAFADEVEGLGGRFLLAFAPSKFRVLAGLCAFPPGSRLAETEVHLTPFRAYLTEWSAAEGMAMIDLTDPLTEAARTGVIPWFWGDTHWNAAGHRVAAEALAGWRPLVP